MSRGSELGILTGILTGGRTDVRSQAHRYALGLQAAAGRRALQSLSLFTLDDIAAVDDLVTRPPWGEFGRAITLAGVGFVGKLTLNYLNTTEIRNGDTLSRIINERAPGVGLVTVCNHTRYFVGRLGLGRTLSYVAHCSADTLPESGRQQPNHVR